MSNGQPPPRRRPTVAGTPATPTRRPTRSRAPDAKLVCTAGPAAGTEYPLEGDEVVAGRATDNPISLPDTSVSRKHISLRRLANGWAVTDLGSGNGTLLNGEPLAEEQSLNDGDVLAIGDSELTYEIADQTEPQRVRPPMPAPRPAAPGPPVSRRRTTVVRPRVTRGGREVEVETPKKSRVLLAFLLVLVVGGLAVVPFVLKARREADKVAAARAAHTEEHSQDDVSVIFQDAKNLVLEGKWAQAQIKLDQVKEMAPDYPGVQEFLARAAKEIPNQEFLDAARAAIDKGQLASAAAALGKVTSDTQQHQLVRSLRQAVEVKATARLREARGAMASGNPSLAREIAEDLVKLSPENRDAKAVFDQARAALDGRDRNRPPAVVDSGGAKPYEAAVARYRDGDLTGALALLDECVAKALPGCKEVADDMREFAQLYKQLEDLDERALERLIKVDRGITGGSPSKMAATANTRAAAIFYKSAASAKAAGQWAKAVQSARKALRADPSHAGAQAMASELASKAKDTYLRAYQLKDASPDDALPMFKDVVALSPEEDEYHQKAKAWVEKLSR